MRRVEERRLSSRDFVNGWVWGSHFLNIPEEGGAVLTSEGVGTLIESLGTPPDISGRLFKDPRLWYQQPEGCLVSILLAAVVILKNNHSCLGCTGFLTVPSHHRPIDKVASAK